MVLLCIVWLWLIWRSRCSIDPYLSGLFHTIALMPVKLSLRIWVKLIGAEPRKNANHLHNSWDLFIQKLIKVNIKEIKDLHYCPFVRGFHLWPVESLPKGQLLILCEGNPLVTSGFPAQRASNAESVSMWWPSSCVATCQEWVSFNPDLHVSWAANSSSTMSK